MQIENAQTHEGAVRLEDSYMEPKLLQGRIVYTTRHEGRYAPIDACYAKPEQAISDVYSYYCIAPDRNLTRAIVMELEELAEQL